MDFADGYLLIVLLLHISPASFVGVIVGVGHALSDVKLATVIGAVCCCLLLPIVNPFGLNGAFWNTIAKPLGDGFSAPWTALQRRNIFRPNRDLKQIIVTSGDFLDGLRRQFHCPKQLCKVHFRFRSVSCVLNIH